MAIDTSGYVTVGEAATRLKLSIEQVRRQLRDGKLQGHRVGNQWFVAERALPTGKAHEPLIAPDIIEHVRRIRERVARRNPDYTWDAVEMVRRSRGER
jgi:excisionase family DNA binding protein